MDRLLVLDTHVWVWLIAGDRRLERTPGLWRVQAGSRDGRLGVAAISVWEIGMLEAKGRLVLPPDRETWARQALSFPGLQFLGLTPEIALAGGHLPGQLHGDPADRLIIATTRVLDGELVTADREIIAYAEQGHVRVVPV